MFSILVRLSQQNFGRQNNLVKSAHTPARARLLPPTQSRLPTSQKMMRQKSPYSLGILLWLATTTAALSQPLIEEQQRLNFGTFAVAENTSVSRFTYPRTGSNINIEGQFVLIASGSPGRYRFSGFPAYTTLTVSVSNASMTAGGSGIPEPLAVDNYDFGDLKTDALGEAELSLGARLNTTGNAGTYTDAPYSGTTVLRVDYWHPDANGYVFNNKAIDLEAEHLSTITIAQEQELNFGTLFARSSSTDQAILNLSPTGSYTITESGNSRLVSLSTPDPGVLRVSGAAPYYSLTITPPAAPVLLKHKENPGSAPHFILSDLVTSPNGTVVTAASGELLIKIGGTLKTELTASPEIYPSGQYEGTYPLTVSY